MSSPWQDPNDFLQDVPELFGDTTQTPPHGSDAACPPRPAHVPPCGGLHPDPEQEGHPCADQ